LPLGKAITSFVSYKTAEGLSQGSVDSYKRILEQWADYAGNKKVSQFSDRDINAYLGEYTRAFAQVTAKYLDQDVFL